MTKERIFFILKRCKKIKEKKDYNVLNVTYVHYNVIHNYVNDIYLYEL